MDNKKRGGKKGEAKMQIKEDKKQGEAAVKEEHESIVINLADSFGTKGFNDDDLSKAIPGLSKDDRASLTNRLVSKGTLDIFVAQSGKVAYKKKQVDSSPTPPSKVSKNNNVKEQHEKIVTTLAESFGDKGFNDDDVSKMIPALSKDDRVLLINKLVSKGVLDIFVTQSGLIVYKKKLIDSSIDPSLKGADTEEKVVYGIIKEAGNKGIWMRDIRFKSNLLPTQLNKVLKSLENKKIIKAVKSVAAHKKKVYMLFNLEPDSTLTGGSWYSGEDFESEFVDVLNQQCYRYLLELKANRDNDKNFKKGPLASVNIISSSPKDVCKFITDLKISNVALSQDDIKTILDTLVYDGKVERKCNASGEFTYRAVDPLLSMSGVTVVPCAVCPVIQRCHENSFVTSIKCPYIKDWGTKKK